MKTVGTLLASAVLFAFVGCAPVEDNDKTFAEKKAEERNSKSSEKGAGTKPKAKPTKEAPEMTGGQENALAKAEEYLSVSAFSRSGLIEQLKFEDFSEADATFAVDQLKPDWNEQAAAKADEYLAVSAFSKQGLIDQLVFEGYTVEQATYGVNQTKLK